MNVTKLYALRSLFRSERHRLDVGLPAMRCLHNAAIQEHLDETRKQLELMATINSELREYDRVLRTLESQRNSESPN